MSDQTFEPDNVFGWIDLAGRNSIIIAVSGGSDSTALLVAFKHWADGRLPHLKLVCVTVDHGLRSRSAEEARHVARFCARLGIAHRVKRWSGVKPATGLPEAARKARYALLAEAAGEAGTDIILTGHTADDQAETVLMRSARGDGRGLAGMARATLFGGKFWIVRPFLTQSRNTLRAQLLSEGVGWIDDPTNLDKGHERVRVRQILQDDPDRYSGLNTAKRHADARSALADEAARLLGEHADLAAPGLVRLDLSMIDAGDARADILRILLACCGGRTYPASRADIAKLADRLEKGRSCMSGAVVTKRRDAIYLYRELRPDEPLRFADGVFDGRYRLAECALGAGWMLAPLDKHADPPPDPVRAMPHSLVCEAMKAEPVLANTSHTDAGRTGPKPEIFRYLAPFDRFLPEFDLMLANAAAALLGREKYPLPPVSEQKQPES